MARMSKGRKKVEMKKISNEEYLHVTFSKRRMGLFKKASELCTLCGAEVVIVVFTPGNKVFSYGHPNVETLIERFLSRSAPQRNRATQLNEANQNCNVRERNMQVTQALKTLEVVKKHGKELEKIRKESQARNWFDKPEEELTLEQLQQLRAALEELRKPVSRKRQNLIIQSSIEQQPPPPPPQQQMTAPPQQQYYMGHSGASSSYAPPGGFNPNMNMTMNQLNANMDLLNINQMIPQPPPPPTGFNNPGFGGGFY